jgi:hypothetical protein
MATSGTKKTAAKKAATTKSTSERSAKTSLQSLTEHVAPPNKALVRIATRSVSRATLNELGQSWVSEDIIAEVPAFIETQLEAWKRLSDEDKQHFIGWSESLAAQVVHEARALEMMLAQFVAESSGESSDKKTSSERYKKLRATAIGQRDRAARALDRVLPEDSDERAKLDTNTMRSDTPDELAKGIAAVASIAKKHIAQSNAEERAALAAMRIDEAFVAALEATAERVKTAGLALKKGAPATRVGQEQLDEQDGVVLRLIQVTWRAWRDGRKVVMSVPLPDLGALRELVRTGSKGEVGEEPPQPGT